MLEHPGCGYNFHKSCRGITCRQTIVKIDMPPDKSHTRSAPKAAHFLAGTAAVL